MPVDAFGIHQQLIDDYRAFTSGFVDIRDRRLSARVAERLESGVQWPDPWVSLNPSFASGGRVSDLIAEGLLHPECERIFQHKTQHGVGDEGMLLRRHDGGFSAARCRAAGCRYWSRTVNLAGAIMSGKPHQTISDPQPGQGPRHSVQEVER